jgi:DNA-binding MarR family transcriptional regulator
METALAAHQLTVGQYSALSAFDLHRQLSSAALARLLDVTPQTMNAVVHDLVGRSLIEREPQPSHGRTLLLQLSPAGRCILDSATETVRVVENTTFGGPGRGQERVVKSWLAELAGGPI